MGTTPSYTHIRDPMLRLCHKLIACSIAGRRQAPEKLTFVARLAEHFGLPTEERLQGLTVIVQDLSVIDMAELAVPAPAQAPQQPLAAEPAQTMAQRLARVEEEVHEIRGALGEQREVMDAMARDLSRFTVWAARCISQLLDSAGATYVRYSKTRVPYQRRRIRQRTGEASTSATLFDEDQPDP
ncbi:hypothetical protein Tco_0617588 [Tanacetum coccineum]